MKSSRNNLPVFHLLSSLPDMICLFFHNRGYQFTTTNLLIINHIIIQRKTSKILHKIIEQSFQAALLKPLYRLEGNTMKSLSSKSYKDLVILVRLLYYLVLYCYIRCYKLIFYSFYNAPIFYSKDSYSGFSIVIYMSPSNQVDVSSPYQLDMNNCFPRPLVPYQIQLQ